MLNKNLKTAVMATVLTVVVGAPIFTTPSIVMAQQQPEKIVSKDKAYDHDGMAYREAQDAQKREQTISKKNAKKEMKQIKRDRRPRNFNEDHKTIEKNREKQNSSGMREINKNRQDNNGMREINKNNQENGGMREINKDRQGAGNMKEINKNNQENGGMREINKNRQDNNGMREINRNNQMPNEAR